MYVRGHTATTMFAWNLHVVMAIFFLNAFFLINIQYYCCSREIMCVLWHFSCCSFQRCLCVAARFPASIQTQLKWKKKILSTKSSVRPHITSIEMKMKYWYDTHINYVSADRVWSKNHSGPIIMTANSFFKLSTFPTYDKIRVIYISSSWIGQYSNRF